MYCAWWLFWALAQTLVLHRLNLNWETALIDAGVSTLLLAIVSFSVMNLYRYYQPGKTSQLYRFIYWVGFSGFYCFVLKYTLGYLLKNDPEYVNFLNLSMPIRFGFSLLITAFITILNWLLNFISDEKKKGQKHNEMEALMREAELSKLRQQLQPHFLFNSLNSISALVGSKPVEARKMVQQLSDFLRGTLKKDDQQLVTLKEELDHLNLYLEIEKVRFGHRLNVEMNSSAESNTCTLPSLLLQPIVENAIKFGLYDNTGDVIIKISGKKEGNGLIVEVENPFDPQTAGANKGLGFGLNSIQRRLFLIYSRQDLLSTQKQDTIFKTTLKIPQ
jgi:two-component system LytT family sensor kinase